MKLSFILELLLVFVLVSFAASRTVQRQSKLISTSELDRQNDDDNSILNEPLSNNVNPLSESPIIDDGDDVIEEESSGGEETNVAVIEETEINDATEALVNVDDRPPINKYCSCSNAVCNCCRDFSLPIVPVRGPGCAEIKYLKNDRLSVTVKYGDFVLANRIVKAGTSKPICIPLPGGFSRFCGRIYGVQRVKEDFKACLGLELRADEEVEAALKVSCFKFGERGLAVTEADPLPAIENEAGNEDDDDDDLFGLGGGDGGDDDDDDDEDDEDTSAGGSDDDDDLFGLGGDDDDEDDESGASDDSPDYSGFSLISDGFEGIFGDDDDGQKKKKVVIKTKNSNASIDAIKNTASLDEHKNDKDAIAPIAEVAKPITEAPVVVVTPTKPKKKKPSGGILDALLGDDDDDDDDEKDSDSDDENDEDDDDDDDDEDDEGDKEEADKEDADEESDDTETVELEEDNKDEEDKEENDDVVENAEDEDNDDEGSDDDEDVTINETDDSNKVNQSEKNKNKKKDDYYGYLSRLMKIF